MLNNDNRISSCNGKKSNNFGRGTVGEKAKEKATQSGYEGFINFRGLTGETVVSDKRERLTD